MNITDCYLTVYENNWLFFQKTSYSCAANIGVYAVNNNGRNTKSLSLITECYISVYEITDYSFRKLVIQARPISVYTQSITMAATLSLCL